MPPMWQLKSSFLPASSEVCRRGLSDLTGSPSMVSSPAPAMLPDSQSSNQRFAVHQFAAGSIDEIRQYVESFPKRSVHHITSFIVDGCMQTDDIADC